MSQERDPERERERAIELGYRAVGYRDRTVAELRTFLERKRVEPEAIADAVEELTAAGVLDDARYARRFAEDKRELRGWGPERIREALAGRGLEQRLIDAALEADDPEAQLERAIELLERRGEPAVDEASRARALAYLARRGYDSEAAYDAVRGFERRTAA